MPAAPARAARSGRSGRAGHLDGHRRHDRGHLRRWQGDPRSRCRQLRRRSVLARVLPHLEGERSARDPQLAVTFPKIRPPMDAARAEVLAFTPVDGSTERSNAALASSAFIPTRRCHPPGWRRPQRSPRRAASLRPPLLLRRLHCQDQTQSATLRSSPQSKPTTDIEKRSESTPSGPDRAERDDADPQSLVDSNG